ncbi:DUF1376 domain-containing protein [Bartonella sp. 1-1C]|uniref:DUF1376 domain-containing protein n=1 Tax=Bartonella sp. 1-1C TaxID=515256 RepID=UPI000C05BDC8|nr:DUF1376 domain-containing protein [Bartonella sp. 1-1C]ATO57166.1 Protein of unknown function (DUF1376) [Bartonella sp. 1-1C]
MSSKIPWTRLNTDQWLFKLSDLPPMEVNVYVKLRVRMLHTREPLLNDSRILSHFTCCTVKRFEKALDYLFRSGHIICLEDGRLWSSDVEEELNNSNENLNKFSERAQKAAQAKWARHHQEKTISDDQDAKHDAKTMLKDAKHMLNDAKHDAKHMLNDAKAMLNDAINNNNNIYNKKTNTIVLAKKEICSENLETNDLIEEPTEVDALQNPSEQNATAVENQPPIHEQENTPKEAKRSKTKKPLVSLPEDFEPNLQYAIDKGLTHDEALLEVERFTNFWKANPCSKAKHRDWQRTWYNWVTNPRYGLLAKKKEDLKKEKRLGDHYGKLTQKTFTEQLAEGFNELRDHLSSREDYGNDQSGVPIDAESWEFIDETGGGASLRFLQSSTSVALCESFS